MVLADPLNQPGPKPAGHVSSIVGDVANSATLAFKRSNTYTFDGVISGSGAVQQNGTGTTIFTAAQSYTGTTTVSAGTLMGGASNVFSAASSTTVNAGATLDLGGFAQTINAVTLDGGTLQNGLLSGSVTSIGGTIINSAVRRA